MANVKDCPTGKARHLTEAAAKTAIRFHPYTGVDLRPYRCNCGGWHLSSAKKRRKANR